MSDPFNEDLYEVILLRLYEDDIVLDNCGGHEEAASSITKAIQYRFDVTAKDIVVAVNECESCCKCKLSTPSRHGCCLHDNTIKQEEEETFEQLLRPPGGFGFWQ